MADRESISHAEFSRFVLEATEQRARADRLEKAMDRQHSGLSNINGLAMLIRDDGLKDGVRLYVDMIELEARAAMKDAAAIADESQQPATEVPD